MIVNRLHSGQERQRREKQGVIKSRYQISFPFLTGLSEQATDKFLIHIITVLFTVTLAADPKSTSLMCPVRSIRTFSGLISL